MNTKKTTLPMDKAALERQSRFRHELRKFLRFGEEAAREAGVTAVQYHLLLHTQGFEGRDWASMGELAERLQTAAHGVGVLVTRCEELGLARRQSHAGDGRLVEVHLTAKGRKLVETLARRHKEQLTGLASVIEAARASTDAP